MRRLAMNDNGRAQDPVQCARPGCTRTFTPKKGGKYCSTRCRRTMQRYKLVLNSGGR